MNRGRITITIALLIIIGVGILGYSLTVYKPAPVVVDPNATFSGYIESEQATRYHSIRVHENVTGIHFVLSCGWSDFDLYGRLGQLPSRNYNDFESIASGGEDYYYSDPLPGLWHLMIYSYTGIGQYNLYIDFDYA